MSLSGRELSGKDAEALLGRAHITVNKNMVPGDTRSPFVTSGLRLGTPAATTRGFGIAEIERVADWTCDVLDAGDDAAVIEGVREQVLALCRRHPVYTAGA